MLRYRGLSFLRSFDRSRRALEADEEEEGRRK